MTRRSEIDRLRALAMLHGVQPSYQDVKGHRVRATEDTLRALLAALGVAARNDSDCEQSWHAELERRAAMPIDEVVVAWNGLLGHIDVRTSSSSGCLIPELQVVLEDGTIHEVSTNQYHLEAVGDSPKWGATILRLHLNAPLHLPNGYHHLVCLTQGGQQSSLLLSAPTQCYQGEPGARREWGLFAPLYALRSGTDNGAGSYSELKDLISYTADMGGSIVGTLPLLPCDYEAGGDPSPYLPLSRLLWSEFYIDTNHISFLRSCPGAQDTPANGAFAQARELLRRSTLVDYPAVDQLRRETLRALFLRLQSSSSFHSEIQRFVLEHPFVPDYATFCAARDYLRTPWQSWPVEARDGNISESLYDDDDKRFREFEQWLAHKQLDECLGDAASRGVGLYLDLPVGVHPEGYDAWRFRDSFVGGAATGAPPDIVFTTGQKWGSPPIHPLGIRTGHYEYARAYLSHHMRAARMLRIDHVMGLHRIFCVPEGAEPASGAYLRYRSEEWYAILSIESHRHKTVLIGEDLGLVPPEVHRAMSRHGLSRMFVLYYEMDGIAAGRIPSVPANSLASLNTHDMPTFAATMNHVDICQHQHVGILAPRDVPAVQETRRRAITGLVDMLRSVCPGVTAAEELAVMLRCTLGWLGASSARYVVVNIEDLWHETAQQNIPGVGAAHPSWRQRTALTIAELRRSATAAHALELLQDAMRRYRLNQGGE